jgi:hypothetical protein
MQRAAVLGGLVAVSLSISVAQAEDTQAPAAPAAAAQGAPAPATSAPATPAPETPAPATPAPATPAAAIPAPATSAPATPAPATPAAATPAPATPAAATPAPATPASATPPASPPPSAVIAVAPEDAEAILGQRVTGPDGQQIGRLVDILVDANGQPQAAIIDFGGFMGVGNRKIAVHWSALRFTPGDPKTKVALEMTQDQIKAAPEFRNPNKPAAVVTPADIAPQSPSPQSPAPQSPAPQSSAPPASSSSGPEPSPRASP